MAAHALTPFLSECDGPATQAQPRAFPYLRLLLSEGHTLLVLARGVSNCSILADANDQAVGNAFDKTARWLNALDVLKGARDVPSCVETLRGFR